VLAIDLSANLIRLARERVPDTTDGRIDFRVGDMLDPALGPFDHVVAMDALIHYAQGDMIDALAALAARTKTSIVFTFAPSTPALSVMHSVGRWFPKGNRAPAIEPVHADRLIASVRAHPALTGWRVGRTERIVSGFYTSQAMELIRA
jgi:magnesium-protoporphyrin O-methyltransferase